MDTAVEAQTAEQSQYLTFQAGGDEYALGVLRVREIIEYDAVTHVPSTPAWIRGVINLRGSVVPVVDLAVKFGLPQSAVTRRSCIVIVEVELEGQRTAMGVMADAVSQVIELRPADIEAPPPFGTRVRVDYLLGMGKVGRRFVLLVDIERVLAASEQLLVSSLELPELPPEGSGGSLPEPDASAQAARAEA